MELYDPISAQALLRLFDDKLTLDFFKINFNDLSQDQKMIYTIISTIDKERNGELFAENPSIHLLNKAYEKGIRIQLGEHDHEHKYKEVNYECGFNVKVIKDGNLINKINIIDGLSTLAPIANLWKTLNLATFGTKKSQYTTQEIGEHIINKLAKDRALSKICEIQYDIPQKNSVDTWEYGNVKRKWNLDSINMKNLDKLWSVLQKSLTEVTNNAQLNYKVEYPGCKSFGFSKDDKTYFKNSRNLTISFILTSFNVDELNLINFNEWLQHFKKYNLTFDLSETSPKTFLSKFTYFSIYDHKKHEEIGEISAEEANKIMPRN